MMCEPALELNRGNGVIEGQSVDRLYPDGIDWTVTRSRFALRAFRQAPSATYINQDIALTRKGLNISGAGEFPVLTPTAKL